MSRTPVRIAIIGAGNCASAFIQGVHFYRNAPAGDQIPGLMHALLGGYHISDLEFSAAFDVTTAKVGLDLAEAIAAPPNNTFRFADVPPLGITVQRGPTLDGLGRYLAETVQESPAPPVDVARILRDTGTNVLLSYLPVGSEIAAAWYAGQALEAGCALVNCMPAFIASDPIWQDRFAQRRLPIIGDDVKSQFGATIVHRVLTRLLADRGLRLDRTYQLNIGGNADFMNMQERERLTSKKISKTQALTSQFNAPLPESSVHVGPSDYIPWLEDRKVCYIRCEATGFGNVPLSFELKLDVWDSPNSAGVVIDAVRCAKLALDRGIGGSLIGPSACFMKSPPEQLTDHEARERTEAFIRENTQHIPVAATPRAPVTASGTTTTRAVAELRT